MKKTISIFIGKLLVFFGKIINRGSSLPGQVAKAINPNILKNFKYPPKVIAVLGSSGKGTTAKMIVDVFKKENYEVGYNYKGSNLLNGIISLMLECSNFRGKIKKNVLVCEIDERYAKYILKNIKPQIVVVTNITRDQPPRQGNVDIILEEILKAINNDMTLVLNSDDPYLQNFAKRTSNNIIYYGINKTKYSTKKEKYQNLNMYYCPMCHTRLSYKYYHFETLGNYYCHNCDFKRPKPNYNIKEIDYNKNQIMINDNLIKTPSTALFYLYNFLACYTVCSFYNINEKNLIYDLSKIESDKKIINTYKYFKRRVWVLNNKNENNTTFNYSLNFIDRDEGIKTIVIGWKEISRRYEYNDLSWLYDIDFEILKKHNIDKIICVGPNKYDIATRIKYAGIEENKILVFENIDSIEQTLKKKTRGTIYAVLNFDYVIPFNLMMRGDTK